MPSGRGDEWPALRRRHSQARPSARASSRRTSRTLSLRCRATWSCQRSSGPLSLILVLAPNSSQKLAPTLPPHHHPRTPALTLLTLTLTLTNQVKRISRYAHLVLTTLPGQAAERTSGRTAFRRTSQEVAISFLPIGIPWSTLREYASVHSVRR